MTNTVNWFEIPATDFARAKKFYAAVLETEITDMPMDNMQYGVFPFDNTNPGAGGAIMQMEGVKPSQDGTTVYLNGGEDLTGALNRVEPAGGKIIMPKTSIGENGFMAQFIDTEGNKVALHSMN